MLIHLRWCVVAMALAACDPEQDDAKQPEPESDAAPMRDTALARDSAVRDAALDAGTPGDATIEMAIADASLPGPALSAGDASTLEDWRAQPEGPPSEPRVVCEGSWATTPFYDLSKPHADPLLFTSDADGNLFIAGYLNGAVDFGTGVLSPPPLPVEDTVRRSTFLLKVDSACNLAWAKSFDPANDKTGRWPLGLGFDDAGNVVLVTNSMRYTYYSRFIDITTHQFDFVVLGQDGSVRTQKSHPSTIGAEVQVSKHGQVMLTAPLVSDGTWGLGDVTIRGERAQECNASFRADGTFVNSELFYPGQGGTEQTLGPHGELAAYVGSGANYYGQAATDVSLIKLDPEGHWQWTQPMPRASDDDTFYQLTALAEDRALDAFRVIHHGLAPDAAHEVSFRGLTSDGTLAWEVPVVESTDYAFTPFKLASSNASLTVYLSLDGSVKVGNTELSSDGSGDDRHVVMQLGRGGAVRWAKKIPELEDVRAITATPSDEAAVMGQLATPGTLGELKIFVRKYAR